MEIKMYEGDLIVTINDSEEIKQKVFDRIIEYMKDNNCTSGEQLQQSDNCLIDAPDVLSDIIDNIMSPETKWIE